MKIELEKKNEGGITVSASQFFVYKQSLEPQNRSQIRSETENSDPFMPLFESTDSFTPAEQQKGRLPPHRIELWTFRLLGERSATEP